VLATWTLHPLSFLTVLVDFSLDITSIPQLKSRRNEKKQRLHHMAAFVCFYSFFLISVSQRFKYAWVSEGVPLLSITTSARFLFSSIGHCAVIRCSASFSDNWFRCIKRFFWRSKGRETTNTSSTIDSYPSS